MTAENEKNPEIPEEYVDIEEFTKAGKEPPKDRKYLIKVDRAFYKVESPCLLGKQILELAGKKPPDRFQLNLRIGGVVKKVNYDETVCFWTPGIERFMTIPLDQTEGSL